MTGGTTPGGPLDGAEEGKRRREEGIRNAEGGAPGYAIADAQEAVEYVAQRRARFTADHVWARLDEMGAPSFPEPRAMGAVMRYAERQQWIEQTHPQQFEPSLRKDRHRSPMRVWVSRLYARERAA